MYIIAKYIIGMDGDPQDPPPRAPDRSGPPLTGLVWRLSMRWQAAINRAVGPCGITHAQYSVLVPLRNLQAQGHAPSQRELADDTGLEPLYISKLVRGLEAAGLVTRTPNPFDSRSVQLALTAEGRAVTAAAVDRVVALQPALTAPLGGPGSRAIADLTAALHTLLDASRRTQE